MNTRVDRITEEVRKYDPQLFAVKKPDGVIQIHRKMEHSKETHFILALTDTWKMTGKPADWGLEPLMKQLRSMDSWLSQEIYQDVIKTRERMEADLKRQKSNEMRAMAADLRKDFARATNDINTSSLSGA